MGISKITVRGARQHNLKNIEVEIPRNTLTVITGLSGSGKSSLAFDTIYAEGQRRYVETLSAYARQFLDQMERPDVDSIDGLSPSISIEQKTTSRSPRSTVGTITEIYDYLRLLYSSVGVPHCPKCGRPISRQSAEQIVARVMAGAEPGAPEERVMILAPIVRGRKGEFKQELAKLAQHGFTRARIDGELLNLEEDIGLDKRKNHTIEVVIDRLLVKAGIEKRLEQSVALAMKLAGGLVQVAVVGGEEHLYSARLACPECGISVPVLEPRSFSFNSIYGACPECNGLGSKYDFDPSKVVVDWSKPLFDGGLGPGSGSTNLQHLAQIAAEAYKIELSTPFEQLPAKTQNLLLYGPEKESGPRTGFRGILHFLKQMLEESTSDSYREWMLNYMSATECPACHGQRLRPESLAVKVNGMSIADFTALPVSRAVDAVAQIKLAGREQQIAGGIVREIAERLQFLHAVGLGYISLNRSAATLSGGEGQRIRLATQIGSKLRGVLYVLDEPSIGLHHRDNNKLLEALRELRDLGNTVLVVEHDEETIRRADYVIDLGPGAGRQGGYVVASGTPAQIEKAANSLTGQYISGKVRIPVRDERRHTNGNNITVQGARENNLKQLDVSFPLGVMTVVTGVSGSGKSTLVNDILYRALARQLYRSREEAGAHKTISGTEKIDKVIRIDQSPIGRTPRSNPATYTGVFTQIRDLYAMLPESRERGYKAGRFSFNVPGGRCEACQGEGQRRIEMNFLPDVYVICEVCGGKRYNHETLAVEYKGYNIAQLLETQVADALPILENIPQVRQKLQTLVDVGLGYIHLGQSAVTLSGGEAQRIKLARELSKRQTGRTLYLLDEPTTGLHFDDVRKLLDVLHRLTDLGNSIIIIEHNLDVIRNADWIIDLGPEGGEDGGRLVAQGTPEQVAKCKKSYTGQALAEYFAAARARRPRDSRRDGGATQAALLRGNSLLSSPDNPLPPEPPPSLVPENTAPPPAAEEMAPLRLPVENPPWSLWDVMRIAALALLAITLFGSIGIGIAGRGLTTAQMQGLQRDPLVVVPAELAADLLVIAYMVWLVRSRGFAFWRGVRWNFPAIRWAGYVAVGALLAIAVQAASALLPIPKELPIDRYFSSAAGAYLMAFFGVAVAPLVEELFFRGFLYPVIARRLGVGAGVVLTAIAFAFIHESQLARAWAPLLLLFVVGLVLTGVRAKMHSVGATWLMHAGYNGALFTLLFFASDHFRHLERLT